MPKIITFAPADNLNCEKMKTTYGLPILREKVLDALKSAFVSNLLDEKEYENRVSQALQADSVESLRAVLHDFPKNELYRIFEQKEAIVVKNEDLPETSSNISTFNSSFSERKQEISLINGVNKIKSFFTEFETDFRRAAVAANLVKIEASSHFSSLIIDLRNENLQGKRVEIRIDCSLGNVRIFLPKGCKIQNNLNSSFGSFVMRNKKKSWISRFLNEQDTPAPEVEFSLTIYGSCFLGEVEIVT